MARTVAVGVQDYEKIIKNNCFYIDKTSFIKEWWDSNDDVTLITRPRRFGKTLNMSMLNCFFSNKYEGRSELFEGLDIWKDKKFRELQGTYPVIFLSFAGVKQDTYDKVRRSINELICSLYDNYHYIMEDSKLTDGNREYYSKIKSDMDDTTAALSLNRLCEYLYKYYGRKCIVLLDEYDTPLQEAYIHGFWDELVTYTRALFNNTFKTNPSMERAIMTGITRVSKESIFSDLNNLTVVTTTSEKYATNFGFTEEEVFRAIEEQGYGDVMKEQVKMWYDGFTFGSHTDIYNPWSITYFLDTGKLDTYWANTSRNGLVSTLIKTGDANLKSQFELLMNGGTIEAKIDEQIIFNQLGNEKDAVWSLLLASGYLKVISIRYEGETLDAYYTMSLTNLEVRSMFGRLIEGWFATGSYFNEFVKAMFAGEDEDMEDYMNEIALATFSSFDTGSSSDDSSGRSGDDTDRRYHPENFYHGFVLGLLVELKERYNIRSNRESGFGRYDVMLIPKNNTDKAVIIEFKAFRKRRETSIEDTVKNAVAQIEEKKYDMELIAAGVSKENILKYGIAFRGKECRVLKG